MTSCRRRAIYWLLRSPSQTCHAKAQNSNQQAPDATSFFPVGGMPTISSSWKTSLRVKGRCGYSRLRAWRFTIELVVVISVRQSTVAAISGSCCRALVMVSSSIRQRLIAKFKEAGGTVREIDVWAESAIISAHSYLHIIVCLSWAVNHYRDNAITYESWHDKNAKRTEAGERSNYWRRCVSVMLLRARCKIHEELADAKEAENDALRDDVAAGRRQLHIKAVCQSVRGPPPPPAWIMQPPPLWMPLNGIISPSERGWSLRKQLEGTRSILMSSADRVCPLPMGNSYDC